MEQAPQIGGVDQYPWTVEELIAVAERVIASHSDLFAQNEASKELNIRLIRDYVVREMIPRPQRVGREARFGLAHIVHLLAVRQLLRSQKWSLPAIKASFATTSTDDLLNGILSPLRPKIDREFRRATKASGAENRAAADTPQTPPLNPAQLLIEQFKAGHATEHEALNQAIFAKSIRASPAFERLQVAASMVSVPAPEVKNKLHFEIDRWCEFVIDAQRLKSLTPEEVERLGEAIKSRLKKEMAS